MKKPDMLVAAIEVLGLMHQFNLTPAHMEALSRTGILKDLLEATRDFTLGGLNFFKLRAALGLKEGLVRRMPKHKYKIPAGQTPMETLFNESGLTEKSRKHFLTTPESDLWEDLSEHEDGENFFLFAVNRSYIGGAISAFDQAGIIPANRRAILKFAAMAPKTSGHLYRVIGLGSTTRYHEVSRLHEHPVLEYELTGNLSSHSLANEWVFSNDDMHRPYLFLGRYDPARTREQDQWLV